MKNILSIKTGVLVVFILTIVLAGCSQSNNSTSGNQASNVPSSPTQSESNAVESGAEATDPYSSYPEKPITWVVPFGTGGTTDTITRILSPVLGSLLGTSVIVDNKPGATGAIGMEFVANAEPDGYTIVQAPVAPLTINPQTGTGNYSTDDFEPITNLLSPVQLIVVAADAPYNTFDELIEYAKQNPDGLNYGSTGLGNLQHIAMLKVLNKYDLDMNQVSYEGAGAMKQAILNRSIQVMVSAENVAASDIDAGTMKGIAYVTDVKGKYDLPSYEELGIGGVNFLTGVLAPKGTPEAIINKLYDAFATAMSDPAIIDQIEKLGETANINASPQEHKEWIEREFEANRIVLDQIGMLKK